MADPFRDLPRGTPLSKITAPQIHGWNEAGRAERGRKFETDHAAGQDPVTSTYIRVENDSASDLDRFSVVRLASPLINYDENSVEFQNNPSAKVDLPGATTDLDVIAILTVPLADQKIGRAIIAGIAPVKINVAGGTEAAWKWADVVPGNADHLTMTEKCGPARVLWKQSGTGVKNALVYLLGPNCAAQVGLCGWEEAPGFDSGADGLVMTVDPGTGCVVLVPTGECDTTAINSFETIRVSGQSDVVADSGTDILTFAAGSGMTIATTPGSDTITFTAAAPNTFSTIAVSGQSDLVADSGTDTLTFAAGSGITLNTNAGTDTLTIINAVGAFGTISVAGQSDVVSDTNSDAVTFAAGTGMAITTSAGTDTVTFTSTGAMLSFVTVAVSGQSDVVAESNSDTLTFVAGSNMTIATDATTDTITFTASGGGSASNSFTTIAVPGQSSVIADSSTDTLNLLPGTGIAIFTDAATDTVLIENTAPTFFRIAVSGQSNVDADGVSDTLRFAEGANITITTDPSTDTVTISASGGGSASDSFTTIAVAGQDSVIADSSTDTVTFAAGAGMAITTNDSTDTITFTNLAPNTFSTIAVSGQSDLVADSGTDTLTFAAGSGITLNTNAGTDTLTIINAAAAFGTVSVSGQADVIANSNSASLTLQSGTGISITSDATTDTILISNNRFTFSTITVAGNSNVDADVGNDTLTFIAGANMTISTDPTTDSITFTASGAGSASDSFTTIAVAGQSSVIADSSTDTLTFANGTNIAITTNAGTDTITIACTANTFTTIAVSGQSDVIADTPGDTVTFAAGSGISINTNAGTDTVTITNAAGAFGTVSVAGQSDVVADSNSDALTFAAGTGISITTTPGTDTVTIANTAVATNTFSTVHVSGQSDVIADSTSDTLTLAPAAGELTITTSAGADQINFGLADVGTAGTTSSSGETKPVLSFDNKGRCYSRGVVGITAPAGALTGNTLADGVIQCSLTTFNGGPITTGVWHATKIAAAYGGTNIDTSASTGIPNIASGAWSVTALLTLVTAMLNGLGTRTTGTVQFPYLDTDNTLKLIDAGICP